MTVIQSLHLNLKNLSSNRIVTKTLLLVCLRGDFFLLCLVLKEMKVFALFWLLRQLKQSRVQRVCEDSSASLYTRDFETAFCEDLH